MIPRSSPAPPRTRNGWSVIAGTGRNGCDRSPTSLVQASRSMWWSPSATRSLSFRISSAACRNQRSIKSWAAHFPRRLPKRLARTKFLQRPKPSGLRRPFVPSIMRSPDAGLLTWRTSPISPSDPGVYEFPRELKRIRSPLVQFLTDVFRPNSLGPSLALRGYYLTGARETEVEQAMPARMTDSVTQAPMEATRTVSRAMPRKCSRSTTLPRRPALAVAGSFVGCSSQISSTGWSYPTNRPESHATSRRTTGVGRYRKMAFAERSADSAPYCAWRSLCPGGTIGACFPKLTAVARRQPNRNGATSLQDLQALDDLRAQVVRLQSGLPWRFHWGLYTGNRILDKARNAYFRQFHRLLLSDLHGQMVADLRGLPANPDAAAPYEPAANTLRAHLMITSGSCAVDTAFPLAAVEARFALESRPASDRTGRYWQTVRSTFTPASWLEEIPCAWRRTAKPVSARGNTCGKSKASTGYMPAFWTNAEKSVAKTNRLRDLASNYTQVLSGPDEVSSAFSPAGWAYLEKASKEANAAALGEPCVAGWSVGCHRELQAESARLHRSSNGCTYATMSIGGENLSKGSP